MHVATTPRDELLTLSSLSLLPNTNGDGGNNSNDNGDGSNKVPLYWVNRKPQALVEPLVKEWDGLVQEEIQALWDLTAQWVDLPLEDEELTSAMTALDDKASTSIACNNQKANSSQNKNKTE